MIGTKMGDGAGNCGEVRERAQETASDFGNASGGTPSSLPAIAAGLDSSLPSLEAMIQGRFAISGTTGGSGTGPE